MTTKHWTEQSPEDFLYSIASDFVEQLREKMKRIGMSQAKLAKAAKVSKGYVSQVFNDPGNLSLVTIVKFAKAVGMKVSVVGYEDTDSEGSGRGPVNADVFRICWERQGKPVDMWSLKQQTTAATANTIDIRSLLDNYALGVKLFWAEVQPIKPSPYESGSFQLPANVNKKSTTLVRRELNAFSATLGE